MSDMLTYKGYIARIEFDAEDQLLVGRLAGINDVIGFHGETVAEVIPAFQEAVDDYIETCARIGKNPERPYSGKVMLRVKPELHARLATAAALAGQSLNRFGEKLLEDALR